MPDMPQDVVFCQIAGTLTETKLFQGGEVRMVLIREVTERRVYAVLRKLFFLDFLNILLKGKDTFEGM